MKSRFEIPAQVATIFGSVSLSQWNDIVSIVGVIIGCAWVIYRWVEFRQDRTCDKRNCPMRHRLEIEKQE